MAKSTRGACLIPAPRALTVSSVLPTPEEMIEHHP